MTNNNRQDNRNFKYDISREDSDETSNRMGNKYDQPKAAFRYRNFREEKEIRNARREDRFKVLKKIPLARMVPHIDPRQPRTVIKDNYNYEDEERKRRTTNRIREENYDLLITKLAIPQSNRYWQYRLFGCL